MTAGGGDPSTGSGGHAWQRLREQRARDLGEDPGPDPEDDHGDAEDTSRRDDDTQRKGQTDAEAETDE